MSMYTNIRIDERELEVGDRGQRAARPVNVEVPNELRYITRAITLRRASGTDIAGMSWALTVSGDPVSLIAYPHRQTKQGVAVEVNRGSRTLLRGSFVATMDNGHTDIFE